jgi:hypothetical protein
MVDMDPVGPLRRPRLPGPSRRCFRPLSTCKQSSLDASSEAQHEYKVGLELIINLSNIYYEYVVKYEYFHKWRLFFEDRAPYLNLEKRRGFFPAYQFAS